MAISCIDELLNISNPITTIAPNQTYTGTLLNNFEADLYKFEMFDFETMTFEIRVFPHDARPISMQLELFQVSGVTLIPLGTSHINQFYNLFTYSGSPSEYKFCLISDNPVDYEIQVQYTTFPFTLFPELDFYHGADMADWEFAQPTVQCDAPVFYTIVAGSLPPGLTMTSGGLISGIPLELDCVTSEDSEPSFTFSEQDGETYVSTSYDFPVTVRAELVGNPSSFVDRDFKCCVRNNWDTDKAAYEASLPNFERVVYIDDEQNGEFTTDGSVAIETTDPTFDEIVAALCQCEEPTEDVQQLTQEEIDALCEQCLIAPEFAGLVEINTDTGCVVCEEPEEPQAIELVDLTNIAFCVPCEEPEIVTGLQTIPDTMCPSCEIDVEETTVEPVLIEGIPEHCLDEFLAKMRNEKICSGPIYCPVKAPVFGTAPEPEVIVLPDICEAECNDSST